MTPRSRPVILLNKKGGDVGSGAAKLYGADIQPRQNVNLQRMRRLVPSSGQLYDNEVVRRPPVVNKSTAHARGFAPGVSLAGVVLCKWGGSCCADLWRTSSWDDSGVTVE